MKLSDNKILLVSHDAGGAQLLAAWASFENITNFKILVEGPATTAFQNIFRSENSYIDYDTAIEDLMKNDFDLVVTSTSWESQLELKIIKLAKKLGIMTISYLDHWVNYRERFGFPNHNWEDNLPDQLWGHDLASLQLINQSFPNIVAENRGNLFLEQRLRNLKSLNVQEIPNTVLFLTEPISKHLGEKMGYNEFDALDLFFGKLSYFFKTPDVTQVTIRPHPSEKKYAQKKYENFLQDNVSLSEEADVFVDLKKHEYIVGCDTIGLYYASILKKKILCAIVNPAFKCSVPIREIFYLRDLP